MLLHLKRAMAFIALGTLSAAALFAQAPQKQWKDRAEYDLVQSIQKEQNAQTKLQLLEQWKQKYPDSQFKDDRDVMMIQAYQATGNAKGMLEVAKAMAAADPRSMPGLYYINLLTLSMADTSPGALDAGEKAAKGLLGILDDVFSPAKKPQNVTDDAWKKERTTYEGVAHRTLGWVAFQRQQYDDALKGLTETLKRNPADVQASVWSGQASLRTKRLEMQSIALYHFCRAAHYEGQGAYPQQTRDQLKANFEKNYVNFHGDKIGIDDVIAKAKENALPPEGFKIESKDEILIKQEEELKKTNPVLALWIGIKRELTGANGAAYFDSTLKNSQIPGGAEVGGTKVEKMKGKLVSCDAPKKAKKLVLGISSPDMSEVTLVFQEPLVVCPDRGIELEFSGVPTEFTAEPFNLTMEVEPADVAGLPPPPKAAAKKAPAAKKATTKKK